MINRALIRLKVIQILYAYYLNDGKNLDAAEKELFYAISKAYDLYNFMLLLMVAVTDQEEKRIEARKCRLKPTPEDLNPNTKFIDNLFIAQLRVNKQLINFVEVQKKTWNNEEDFLKRLLALIQGTDLYKDYMSRKEVSYEEDKEFWRHIFKDVIMKNSEIDQLLEDMSLYWNDDRTIVDTFVLKTIKRFEEKNGPEQELLEEFRDEEDKDFARTLFRKSILNADQYRKLISEGTRNWDLERIAFMDVVIMQTALAEILSFNNIPVSVSLNEYVELAKLYSTGKSGSFVNGTLEGVVRKLREDKKITKN